MNGKKIVAMLVAVMGWSLFGHTEDEAVKKWTFEKDPIGTLPKEWKVAETDSKGSPGTWKIVSMENASGDQGQVLALMETINTKRTYNLVINHKTMYQDLVCSVKVRAVTGTEDQGGGPIWRVIDADNYYIARWNPLENNFRVYFVKEGKRKQIATVDLEVEPTKWHEITIAMKGNLIAASLDGKPYIEVTDDTFLEAGRIGLWTKADAVTAFDDLTVQPTENGQK